MTYGIYAHTENTYNNMIAHTEWSMKYWVKRLLSLDSIVKVVVYNYETLERKEYVK